MSRSEAGSSATSGSTITGTTEELFRIWQVDCSKGNKGLARRKDNLRLTARSFLQSLVAGTEFVVSTETESSKKVVLRTKASHEEALALLIQELGPALSSDRHACRICALATLSGAIEGCQTIVLSIQIVRLLGTFLLGHCGPIQQQQQQQQDDVVMDESMLNGGGEKGWEDNDAQDYDEQVRDAAIGGLTALLSGASMSTTEASETLTQSELVEVVRCRLELAQKGVTNRCAAPELDEVQGYNSGYGEPERPRVQSGLALLPRSRRALCFSLLQALVNGVACLVKECPPSVASATELESELAVFATFTASCLHGESDPRCLMQLLQLFSALLPAFQPFFSATKSSKFPITHMFDAVAPYYPIAFTPPPNDVHGITKSGLKKALLSVLSYTGYDAFVDVNAAADAAAVAGPEQDTMLRLTLGIVLERIVPPEEDDPTTTFDKLEALKDLSEILFSTGSNMPSNCDKLDAATHYELAKVFMVVHDAASMTFGQGGGKDMQAKELADLCRTIVAQVALDLEQASDKKLWETFVAEPLRILSSRILTSPSESRTAIAYVACLCASGGPKTLRCSLESALVPLFDTVSSDMKDAGDIATAAYGIGAFFSSCRVALRKAKQAGIAIHPHPLANYCGSAIDKLSELLTADVNGDRSIHIAAVRAMESVLVVSPAEHLTSDHVQKATRFVESILATVVEGAPVVEESQGETEWCRACAESIGSLLGAAMNAIDGEDDVASELEDSILGKEGTLRSFLLEGTFTKLVSFVGKSFENRSVGRWESKSLALAASSSLPAASRIVGFLVDSLHASLQKDSQGSAAQGFAVTLSFILRQGGSLASKAYFELSAPSVTPIDVLNVLASLSGRTVKKGGMQSAGVSILQLPPTKDYFEKTTKTIDSAYDFIPYLLPAYQNRVSRTHLEKLVSVVSQALPPLDDTDTIKLCVYLPFLSAAIEHAESPPESARTADDKAMEENWISMVPELADFALRAEHYPSARSHAAASLHGLISRLIPRGKEPCPSLTLLRSVVLPSLQNSLDLAGKETDRRGKRAESFADAVSKFIDGLTLAAVLGSAAACRGGTSSKTAARTVSFLADLACSKQSAGDFDDAMSFPIDLTVFDKEDPQQPSTVSTELAIAAASALGSILSTEGGSPLLKQRLTHISVKRVVQQLQDPASKPEAQPLAVLATVSHVICSSSLRNIADSDMQVITGMVVGGLSSISSLTADAKNQSTELITNALVVKKIVLAAVVKIICTKQTAALSRSIHFVVTGLMRAYAVTVDSDPVSEITCKLLALQGLATVIRIEGAKGTLQALQKAVVSLLSAAMNHPSSLLRHAAVEARNAWFLLD
jgi:hypothetical protein